MGSERRWHGENLAKPAKGLARSYRTAGAAGDAKKTRVPRAGDRIGAAAGMSGRSYEKAEAVVAAAEAEVRRERIPPAASPTFTRGRFSRSLPCLGSGPADRF